MNNFTFYSPTLFAFGQGEASRVGALVRQFGGSKVLLVAGGGSVLKNGAYNAAAAARLKNQSFGERHLCCNPTDENQLYFITRHAKKGAVLVVIAPNERMAETLERVVPKTVIYR